MIEQSVSEGPHLPKNSDFPTHVENSPFPSYVLQTKLNNGEMIKRDWLAYSPSKQAIYCFPCKLFQNDVKTPSSLVSSGWDKSKGWKKLYNRIPEHEKSAAHKNQYMRWRELEVRLRNSIGIHDLLCDQIESEKQKVATCPKMCSRCRFNIS